MPTVFEETKDPRKFTRDTPDRHGRKACDHENMIGVGIRHWKFRQVYMVTGIVWNGDTDEWCYVLERMDDFDSPTVVRSLENVESEASPGVPRFTVVAYRPKRR